VPDTPPLTVELRAAASNHPGQWLYVIDPCFDANDEVPPYGVVGVWQVDERGEVTGEFHRNPNYRPSPVALGYPDPTDPLDAAIQLSSVEYLDGDAIAPIFMEAEVLVGVGDEGAVTVFHHDGGKVVLTFSAEDHAPDDLPESVRGWQRMRGRELASLLPADVDIVVNPFGALSVRLPRDARADRILIA
jgi:hypothetical protein